MEPTTDLNEAVDNPRSRRALLAGVVGGVGAWLVSAAQRAMPVEAAAGDAIRMGQLNKASGTSTTVQTSTTQPVLRAVQLGGGNALRGEATTGRAVVGIGGSGGTGLWGYSPNHRAIFGRTESGWGVWGEATGSNAVGVFAGAWGTNSFALETNGPTRFFGDVRMMLGGAPGDGGALTMDARAASPAAPISGATLFVQIASGKRQLVVRFPTGDVQVLATEP